MGIHAIAFRDALEMAIRRRLECDIDRVATRVPGDPPQDRAL
jgi:hypothetical protein